ncbi:MAG: Txe/YoeB family addiction module toxin [Paludibacteraceae bacterium]
MELKFKPTAEDDLAYWFKKNKAVISKIQKLLKSVLDVPFHGIEKPELLKGNLSGYWSRRITDEHRMIYITVHSLRGHYKK